MELEPSSNEIQRRVLQHTLEEISTRREEEDNDDVAVECCVICLEAVTEACAAIPCQHRNFDYLCLLSWLDQSQKCPLCKTVVAKVRYDFDGEASKTYIVPPSAPKQSESAQTTTDRNVRDSSSTVDHSRRRFLRPRPLREYPTHRREQSTNEALARRRHVYRRSLFSKHVGSNRISRYNELKPQMFCSDAELVSRARMWIRRELQVFAFLSLGDDTDDGVARQSAGSTPAQTPTERRRANNAEFLMEYIVAILKSVDIRGSRGQAENMLSDFLGRDNTQLFLHELRAWLRSSFTKLEDWDRAVQYDESGGARIDANVASRDGSRALASARTDTPILDQGRDSLRKGDYYRPSGGGPWRSRHGSSSRREPYRSQSNGRDTHRR